MRACFRGQTLCIEMVRYKFVIRGRHFLIWSISITEPRRRDWHELHGHHLLSHTLGQVFLTSVAEADKLAARLLLVEKLLISSSSVAALR